MRSYKHEIEAPVEQIKYGRMFYGGIFLDEMFLSTYPQARKRGFRIIGEVGGLFNEFGLMAIKTRRYVVLSKSFLKQSNLKTGDVVLFRFSPLDPNHVEVPVELERALASNKSAFSFWSNLTSGKKRSYSYRVASGVQEATRLQRAYHIIELLTS